MVRYYGHLNLPVLGSRLVATKFAGEVGSSPSIIARQHVGHGVGVSHLDGLLAFFGTTLSLDLRNKENSRIDSMIFRRSNVVDVSIFSQIKKSS